MEDYSKKLETTKSVEKSFNAISSGMGKWWAESIKPFEKTGDEFNAIFTGVGSAHWRFKVKEFEKNKKVVLECIEAFHEIHDFPEDRRSEWLGTQLLFVINKTKIGSDILFTHQGLNEELLCNDICVEGWDFFFGARLKEYLKTI